MLTKKAQAQRYRQLAKHTPLAEPEAKALAHLVATRFFRKQIEPDVAQRLIDLGLARECLGGGLMPTDKGRLYHMDS